MIRGNNGERTINAPVWKLFSERATGEKSCNALCDGGVILSWGAPHSEGSSEVVGGWGLKLPTLGEGDGGETVYCGNISLFWKTFLKNWANNNRRNQSIQNWGISVSTLKFWFCCWYWRFVCCVVALCFIKSLFKSVKQKWEYFFKRTNGQNKVNKKFIIKRQKGFSAHKLFFLYFILFIFCLFRLNHNATNDNE